MHGDSMKKLSTLILLILILPVNGAVIKGNIYSWELNKIGAIVEINTTPKQRIVALNGSYMFEIPSGTYEIKAYSIDGNLFCNETVNVTRNGTYTIDLILFPRLEESKLNITELDFAFERESGIDQTIIYVVIAICSFSALITYTLFRIFRRKRIDILSNDLKIVLELIKSAGGRITQKELREKLGWSEAKLSLVLSDLERRGLIEKYKKGRGNIIFLK